MQLLLFTVAVSATVLIQECSTKLSSPGEAFNDNDMEKHRKLVRDAEEYFAKTEKYKEELKEHLLPITFQQFIEMLNENSLNTKTHLQLYRLHLRSKPEVGVTWYNRTRAKVVSFNLKKEQLDQLENEGFFKDVEQGEHIRKLLSGNGKQEL